MTSYSCGRNRPNPDDPTRTRNQTSFGSSISTSISGSFDKRNSRDSRLDRRAAKGSQSIWSDQREKRYAPSLNGSHPMKTLREAVLMYLYPLNIQRTNTVNGTLNWSLGRFHKRHLETTETPPPPRMNIQIACAKTKIGN